MIEFEPISTYNRLMKTYNWQQRDWPHFRYDISALHSTLQAIAEKSGLISGKLAHLDANQQLEALINLMVEEAVKTSEIEGEYISRPDVRSSIKNKLGLSSNTNRVHDKRAEGIVDMMFDARNKFKYPLTDTNLFEWHLMLFSRSNNPNLSIGTWRTHEEPMQVISVRNNKSIVHFEAPPSQDIPREMQEFIHWFNATAPGNPQAIVFAPVRAAIAHLYFESVHPFEDGNGRIGRIISEKALSQGFGYPIMLSLSQAIESDKKAYYDALHIASKSNEITSWIAYFINVVTKAQQEVEEQINFILMKSRFFDKFENALNERQLKVIKRMMSSGTKGFEGGMSAKKYMAITGASKATATRDLQHMLTIHALEQIGSGRSIRYQLHLENILKESR